jgi:hypothetical protein
MPWSPPVAADAGLGDLPGRRRDGTVPRRLDRGDVYLLHNHHRVKRAFCFIATSR